MNQSLSVYCPDPISANKACNEGWRIAKAMTTAGTPVEVIVRKAEDERSLRANRFYWGFVLKTIANFVELGGQKYSADAWHELMKRTYLGYEIKKYRVAGKKKLQIIRRLRSTADLSVKQFCIYLEQIIAYGATDLGIEWNCPPPKEVVNSKVRGLVIDHETGEIVSGL